MSEQVRTMLAELVDTVPVTVDVDRQIVTGRRRARRRRVLGAGSAVVAVVALAAGVAVAAGPTARTGPAASATPVPPSSVGPPKTSAASPTPSRTGMPPILRTTATSQALLARLRALAPELGSIPGGDYWSVERFYPDAPAHRLGAGVDWQLDDSAILVDVSIDPRDLGIEACGDYVRCTEVRHLPGGAVAYARSWLNDNGEGLDPADPGAGAQLVEVRLVRPDGFDVYVRASSQVLRAYRHDPAHPAPLTLDRAIAVAAGITITP